MGGHGRRPRERTLARASWWRTGALVPVTVEGVRGHAVRAGGRAADPRRGRGGGRRRGGRDGWRIGRPGGSSRAWPSSPRSTRSRWDRDLLLRLWGFDYRWEVYVPAAKRRWGYYVLPLLYGDRFVGRIEPRIDRKTGTLRILGLWWEDGFDPLDRREPGVHGRVRRRDPRPPRVRRPAQGGDAPGRAAPRVRGAVRERLEAGGRSAAPATAPGDEGQAGAASASGAGSVLRVASSAAP